MIIVRGNGNRRQNKNPPPEFAGSGFVKSWLLVYSSNLPPPAIRAMATGRSHAARFDIEFSLAMKRFISFKIAPALYRTRISGQPIISVYYESHSIARPAVPGSTNDWGNCE